MTLCFTYADDDDDLQTGLCLVCFFYYVFFLMSCPLLISLYNIVVLKIICRFESTLLLEYANPCRIGPSNASQGQHRRKDATEQTKNLTLAMTRTQVPGFSSADALTTKLRGPFFYAVLAKRWKVQFDKGLHILTTTLIQHDI